MPCHRQLQGDRNRLPLRWLSLGCPTISLRGAAPHRALTRSFPAQANVVLGSILAVQNQPILLLAAAAGLSAVNGLLGGKESLCREVKLLLRLDSELDFRCIKCVRPVDKLDSESCRVLGKDRVKPLFKSVALSTRLTEPPSQQPSICEYAKNGWLCTPENRNSPKSHSSFGTRFWKRLYLGIIREMGLFQVAKNSMCPQNLNQ